MLIHEEQSDLGLHINCHFIFHPLDALPHRKVKVFSTIIVMLLSNLYGGDNH